MKYVVLLLVLSLSAFAVDISACNTEASPITAGGTYTLTADLSVPAGHDCIYVNTGGVLPSSESDVVFIRCNGHTILNTDSRGLFPVHVVNSPGTQVTNCTIRTWNHWSGYAGIRFDDTQSSYTYQHYAGTNTLYAASIQNYNGTNFSAGFNTIYGGVINSMESGRAPNSGRGAVLIAANNITSPSAWTSPDGAIGLYSAAIGFSSMVPFQKLYDIYVIGNIIDGSWSGSTMGSNTNYTIDGSEQGVQFTTGCDGCLIQGNSIRNVWGGGWETVGPHSNLTVTSNTVKDFGQQCWLAFWFTSLSSVSISNNSCDDSSAVKWNTSGNGAFPMFAFLYYGLLYPSQQASLVDAQYRNVTVSGNTYKSPVNKLSSYDVYADFVEGNGTAGVSGTNTWTNNHFISYSGASKMIRVRPGNMITDGGGNTCKSSAGASLPWTWEAIVNPPYPITCE